MPRNENATFATIIGIYWVLKKGAPHFSRFRQRPRISVKVLTPGEKGKRPSPEFDGKATGFRLFNRAEEGRLI